MSIQFSLEHKAPNLTMLPIQEAPLIFTGRLTDQLTNAKSRLFDLHDVASDLYDKTPDSHTEADAFFTVADAFSHLAQEACSSYRPERVAGPHLLCNSGNDGVYFRGKDTCKKCHLINSDNLPGMRTKQFKYVEPSNSRGIFGDSGQMVTVFQKKDGSVFHISAVPVREVLRSTNQ